MRTISYIFLIVFLASCTTSNIKSTDNLRPGFVLTFEDDFTNKKLDKKSWYPGLPYDWNSSSLNEESQSYHEKNIELEHGILKLVMKREEVLGLKNGKEKEFSYSSGAISTKNQIYQTYGIFEVRAKLSPVLGSWPAFWLMPENENIYKPIGAEIDIFENLAKWGEKIQFGIHYDGYGKDHQTWNTGKVPVSGIFDDFHTYSLYWDPDRLTLYIDDQFIGEYTGPAVPTSSHYIIINNALGGWGGYIDDDKLPASMEIDYVRVYQFDNMERIKKMEKERVIKEALEAKIPKKRPMSVGLDFEDMDLEVLKSSSANGDPNFASKYITLTDDTSKVISGDKSLLVNTMETSNQWNEFFHSRVGELEADTSYTIEFDYKVHKINKGSLFYTLVRSLSRKDGAEDKGWYEWVFEPGKEDHVVMNIHTDQYGDYFLIIGIMYNGEISIDNIQINKR